MTHPREPDVWQSMGVIGDDDHPFIMLTWVNPDDGVKWAAPGCARWPCWVDGEWRIPAVWVRADQLKKIRLT